MGVYFGRICIKINERYGLGVVAVVVVVACHYCCMVGFIGIRVIPDPRFICLAPLNNNCSRYSMIVIGAGAVTVTVTVTAVASCSLIYCALGVWLRSSSSLVA